MIQSESDRAIKGYLSRIKSIIMKLKIDQVLTRIVKERRLTLKALSKLSGVPSTTLHEWQNGRSPRDPVQAKKVADALEISLNQLLFDEPDSNERISIQSVLKEDVFSGTFEISIKRIKEKK